MALLLLGGCAGVTDATASGASAAGATEDLVGLTDRAAIEQTLPAWRDAIAAASPDEETARALAEVPAGAEVEVFLGTWCSDSRREVSRLFVALARAEAQGPLPFTVRFVGVDRNKRAPGLSESASLRYVPTILVRREGHEVGRVVETAPDSIESDLLALLRGERSGWVSGSRVE